MRKYRNDGMFRCICGATWQEDNTCTNGHIFDEYVHIETPDAKEPQVGGLADLVMGILVPKYSVLMPVLLIAAVVLAAQYVPWQAVGGAGVLLAGVGVVVFLGKKSNRS